MTSFLPSSQSQGGGLKKCGRAFRLQVGQHARSPRNQQPTPFEDLTILRSERELCSYGRAISRTDAPTVPLSVDVLPRKRNLSRVYRCGLVFPVSCGFEFECECEGHGSSFSTRNAIARSIPVVPRLCSSVNDPRCWSIWNIKATYSFGT